MFTTIWQLLCSGFTVSINCYIPSQCCIMGKNACDLNDKSTICSRSQQWKHECSACWLMEAGNHVYVSLNAVFWLSPKYWMVGNWYSQLLFTTEDCFCANLHMQEKQCIWHTNGSTSSSYDVTDWTVVMSQVRKDHPEQKWLNEQSIIVLDDLCAPSSHKIAWRNLTNI